LNENATLNADDENCDQNIELLKLRKQVHPTTFVWVGGQIP